MTERERPGMIVVVAVAFVLMLLPESPSAEERTATLWELQGEHNRIFLLGSLHLMRRSDYPIPDLIYVAYDEAETLIMELDMDDLDPAQSQAMVRELGMIWDGGSLADLLGAKPYAKARSLADQNQIPLESFDRLEPWLAAVTIESIIMTRLGFEVSQGIESHFISKATSDGKEIIGLETERQQLEMLDSLSADAQRELLLQTLAEGDGLKDVLDDIIVAWRHGDIASLEKTLLEDISKLEELHQAIIVDRNRNWTRQINALLDDNDDYLIIVGTSHLVGRDGVPNLLRLQGHEIEQMQ